MICRVMFKTGRYHQLTDINSRGAGYGKVVLRKCLTAIYFINRETVRHMSKLEENLHISRVYRRQNHWPPRRISGLPAYIQTVFRKCRVLCWSSNWSYGANWCTLPWVESNDFFHISLLEFPVMENYALLRKTSLKIKMYLLLLTAIPRWPQQYTPRKQLKTHGAPAPGVQWSVLYRIQAHLQT